MYCDALYSYHLCTYILVVSPLAPYKADLVSLVVPVMRGLEQSLVVGGLDLCRGLLTLPGYLDHNQVLN